MPDVSLNTSVDDHMSSARLPIVNISSYLAEGASQAEKEATQRSLDSACREFGMSMTGDISDIRHVSDLARIFLCDWSRP